MPKMASKNCTLYDVGVMVFAKIKYLPYWPAVIQDILTDDKTTKYNVTFFGDNTTALIKQSDMCLYEEYKSIHGKPKTDNFKNKMFNKALEEAEQAFKTSFPSKPLIQNEDPNHKKSDAPNTSIKHLEESLTEESLLENSENDEEKLKLAAKIGTALLEENELLKRQHFELESKLTAAEEKAEILETEKETYALKIEDLLHQIEELHNNSKKEKQIHSEIQRMFEENDRKQNQIINEYLLKINDLEKNINALKENLKSHATPDKESLIYTNSETQNGQNKQNTNTTLIDNTAFFIELAEVKSKQHLLEEDIKTLKTEVAESKSRSATKSNYNISRCNSPKSSPKSNTKKWKTSQPLNKNKSSENNRKNHFSISLQMVKSKSGQNPPSKTENTTKITPIPSSEKSPGPKAKQPPKTPPMYAKVRPEDQSVDEFIEKNIEFYLKIMDKQSRSLPINNSTVSLPPAVLPQLLPSCTPPSLSSIQELQIDTLKHARKEENSEELAKEGNSQPSSETKTSFSFLGTKPVHNKAI